MFGRFKYMDDLFYGEINNGIVTSRDGDGKTYEVEELEAR
jgi:hypothetical protein